MLASSWRNWMGGNRKSRCAGRAVERRRGNPQRYFKPSFEPLEDRRVLSAGAIPGLVVPDNTGSPTPVGVSPTSLSSYYGLDHVGSTGSGEAIAIVDLYSDPTILADVTAFNQQYNLPQFNTGSGPTLTVSQPSPSVNNTETTSSTWPLEIALDLEWAHAIAPQANIDLIEVAGPQATDPNIGPDTNTALLYGVAYANDLAPNVVSMSFAGSESGWTSATGETLSQLDQQYFSTSGVTYVAGAGDNGEVGGAQYPASSPNVLSVGGTMMSTPGNVPTGAETTWNWSVPGNYAGEAATGGGVSGSEPRPNYQALTPVSSSTRIYPDVAMFAGGTPSGGGAGGAAVYYNGSWTDPGGTSVGTPIWAAMIAMVDQRRAASGQPSLTGATQTLPAIYSLSHADFDDITTGNNTIYSPSGTVVQSGYSAAPGSDEVTGLGTPIANSLIPQLAATSFTDPQLAGTWMFSGNQTCSITESGNSLEFTNNVGGTSAGYFLTTDQVIATNWGNLVGTIVSTPTAREIVFTNGSVWQQPQLGGQWFFTGSAACSVTQTAGPSGTTLQFTNNVGGTSSGHFISSTQVVATDWGNLVGTIVASPTALQIIWANDTTWQQPSVAGEWFFVGNQACLIMQSASGLQIVNNVGGTSPGIFLNANQIEATGWGNLVGTVTWTPAGEQIQWSNGTVFVQPHVAGQWFSNGNLADSISQTSAGLVITNYEGGTSPGVILNSTQIEATGWGNLVGNLVSTSTGLSINWTNGSVWQQPELNGQWIFSGNEVCQLYDSAAGLEFVNNVGGMSPGLFLSTTEVEATAWPYNGQPLTGNIVTTATGLEINWANGSSWQQPTIIGTWWYFGQACYASETATGLLLTNNVGQTTAATVIGTNEIYASNWNITATIAIVSGNLELEFSNGTAWTKQS